MKNRKLILYFCEQCGKSGITSFTQDDKDSALEKGGLFTRILDHGNHIIELKVDQHGVVRQEYIFRKIEFETSMELFRILQMSDSREQSINALKQLIGLTLTNKQESEKNNHFVKDMVDKINVLKWVFESLVEEINEVEKRLSDLKSDARF